jgi:DNA-binding transcriptional LysR family regulator
MKFDKEFLKKIRLEDLNVFITLCEEKNYSMAAKKLGKTQGTISSEIARLEECFGKNIKLINRTSKTFEITKNGEKLLEFANSTILNFQNLLNSLEEYLPDLIGNLKKFQAFIYWRTYITTSY